MSGGFALQIPNGLSRRLAAAWLLLGVAALGVASLFAVALVVARIPPLAKLFPAVDFFYPSLVLHVNLSLLVWFLATACALWSLHSGERRGGWGWGAFALAAAGTVLLVLAPLAGGEVVMADYVPVLDNRWFFTGLGGFAAGVIAAASRRLAAGGFGWHGDDAGARLGLTLAAVGALAAGALFAVAYLNADSGAGPHVFYQGLFWSGGHALQGVFALLAVVAWLHLAEAAGMQVGGRTGRGLVLLAFTPVAVMLALPLVFAGGALRDAYTVLMAVGGWLAFLPVASLVVAEGYRRWRACQAALPGVLHLSLLLFLAGALAGGMIRTGSFLVPAHYHGAIGAVTLAFMLLATRLLPALGGTPLPRRADLAAPLYGFGTLLLVIAMAVAGYIGVPRKTPGDPGGLEPAAVVSLLSMGGGALVALAGTFLFVRWWLHAARPLLPARRGDRRLAALLATVALVTGIGLFVTAQPGTGVVPRSELPAEWKAVLAPTAAPSVNPKADPSGHAAEARRLELDARFKQAVAMLHAGQYDYAIAALHRVLELSPTLVEAHVNMGYALLGKADYMAAHDFFQGATELRPQQANAYFGLALALEGLGEIDAAVGAMQAFLHLSPADGPYQSRAVAALWEWDDRRGKLSAPVPPADAVAPRPKGEG
jgi:cytochrome c oxidase subunit 1